MIRLVAVLIDVLINVFHAVRNNRRIVFIPYFYLHNVVFYEPSLVNIL